MKTRTIGRLLMLALFAGFPLVTTGCEDEGDVEEIAHETDLGEDSSDEVASGPFTSAEGRFTITYPAGSATPQMETVPVPTEIGNINMNMFLVDADTMAYMTAYADYPDSLISMSEPQMMLDMGRDGAITNVNGELLREKDHTVQGYPAKEFYARGEQGGQDVYMRANIIMAKERLYQVLYLAFTEDQLDSREADDYIASFRIDGIEEAADAADVGDEEEADID